MRLDKKVTSKYIEIRGQGSVRESYFVIKQVCFYG